jgi:activating signal cointegrator complex subunit 3
VLCDASEFDELPVRHNEEHVHAQMAKELPWRVDERSLDSPHVKANLLLQAHFARSPLPMSDYVTDTKSVLDQALRVLQAMVDVAADGGWLFTALNTMHLAQMITQGRWVDEPSMVMRDLPHIDDKVAATLARNGVRQLSHLLVAAGGKPEALRHGPLRGANLKERQLNELHSVLRTLPNVSLHVDEPPPLAPGEEGSVRIRLAASNPASRAKAFAPRFPKPKLAGWWVVMGEEDELLALKRVRIERGSTSTDLLFSAPDEPGEYVWAVHLVSDSYIGLDRAAEVRITVNDGTRPCGALP